MKKHLPTILLVLVFTVGLSLLLYPTVSNYINSIHQSRSIAEYQENLNSLTSEDYSNMRQAAEAYNRILAEKPGQFFFSDAEDAEYNSLLNITDDGIMGYIEIDAINVKLPIYHGTAETILQVGVGHLEGSSLPVGGTSTHTVLSGHRGLPSAKLFSNLNKLAEGDIFLIHTMDQILVYRVDQILVVEPDETDSLQIVEGKDYCTLVTCTPYGINSHRLLVRGVRTDLDKDTLFNMQVTADAVKIDPAVVVPVAMVPVLGALLLWLLVFNARTASRHRKKGDRK